MPMARETAREGRSDDRVPRATRARKLSIELDGGDASPATIQVIGVGGGGSNAVNRMISAGVKGVEYFACNTDLQALRKCAAPIKLQIGSRLTKGLGAGADPDVGRNAALEDQEKLAHAVAGADMVFLAMGLGGGTGSGAGPIIAKLAAEAGALAVAVVTKPFEFEGKKRMRQAERASRELRDHVDTLITIPNQRLLSFVERNTPLQESFKIADDVLRQAIQGISDLINCPGEINLDFADVRKIMSDMGRALMGTAMADGENRAIHAAQAAISLAAARGRVDRGRARRPDEHHGRRRPDALRGDRGGADHPAGGGSRGRDPLRLRPRRADGRQRQGHGHRDRLRPARARPRRESRRSRSPCTVATKPLRPPFLRGDDSGGFGPNASSRDDFDIPTVLRRQMD